MTPTRFAVVGTAWSSRFCIRVAAAAPDRLALTGVLVREPCRARRDRATDPPARPRLRRRLVVTAVQGRPRPVRARGGVRDGEW